MLSLKLDCAQRRSVAVLKLNVCVVVVSDMICVESCENGSQDITEQCSSSNVSASVYAEDNVRL